MFRLRACPRCHGDLYVEHNEFDEVETYCLHCGARKFGIRVDAAGPVENRGEAEVTQAA